MVRNSLPAGTGFVTISGPIHPRPKRGASLIQEMVSQGCDHVGVSANVTDGLIGSALEWFFY